nr:MAG TPA: hypothetical protein [Caudoviricetes sp.]
MFARRQKPRSYLKLASAVIAFNLNLKIHNITPFPYLQYNTNWNGEKGGKTNWKSSRNP